MASFRFGGQGGECQWLAWKLSFGWVEHDGVLGQDRQEAFPQFERSDGCSDTFPCDATPIDFAPFVRENDQPCFFLRHAMRVLIDTDILKEKMSEIPKELVGAAVRAMGFSRKGVLPKIFF